MCQQGAAEADWMRERDREIRRSGYEAFGNGEPKKTEEPGGGKIEFDSDAYHFNLGWGNSTGREGGVVKRIRTGTVTVPDRHGINGESWRVPAQVSLTPVFPQREHDKDFFEALDAFLLPLSKNTLGQMQVQGNYRSCSIFDPNNSTEESKLYSVMETYGFVRTGRGQGVEVGIDITHQRIKLIWLYDGCELKPDVHFLPLDGGTATTLACLREAQAQKTARPDMKPYETAMDKSEYGIRARQRREDDKKIVFKFN